MNKSELVKAMSEKAGLSQVATKQALDAFIEVVTETLAKEDSIALVGFGTFSVANRSERQRNNPLTKKSITIPAKKVAKFKVGAALADAVAK